MMMPPRSDKLNRNADIAANTDYIITIHNSAIYRPNMFKLYKLLANTYTYMAIISLETGFGSY